MSRIGRMPIAIPAGVKVELDGHHIKVTGPKGALERELHPDIEIIVEENQVLINRASDDKNHRALHGLTRALVNNMVVGVTTGFHRNMELVGVGYRAAMQGSKLVLTVGYSKPVEMELPEGISVEVVSPIRFRIMGIDKQKVGAFAANVHAVRPPEPYKGKGIRYEGEVVKRKAGKAGKA